MRVLNRKMMTCPFDEYIKLPGWSYSGIKSYGKEIIVPTKKMQLGTHVHQYLLSPEDYGFDDVAIVRPLAVALKQRIGPLFAFLQPELAVQCLFVHEGMAMQYKGRGDLVIPDKIVIDIKVSEQPLHKGIEYFGYDKQTSGYSIGFNTRVALILAINPKNFLIAMKNVPIDSGWWEYQIKKRGGPYE